MRNFHLLALLCCLILVGGCAEPERVKTEDELQLEAKVKKVIEEGKLSGTRGASALITAADKGAPDAVRMLLEAGVEPDSVKKRGGETALFCACKRTSRGALEAAEVLLEAGADPNKKISPDSGNTPRTPFLKAAKNPNPGVLELVLRYHPDLSTPASQGSGLGAKVVNGTALHLAASSGLHEQVKLLLDAGADRSAKDKQGKTALDVLEGTPEKARSFHRKTVQAWSHAAADQVDYDKTQALLGGS